MEPLDHDLRGEDRVENSNEYEEELGPEEGDYVTLAYPFVQLYEPKRIHLFYSLLVNLHNGTHYCIGLCFI